VLVASTAALSAPGSTLLPDTSLLLIAIAPLERAFGSTGLL
jgi:hypothetical protein